MYTIEMQEILWQKRHWRKYVLKLFVEHIIRGKREDNFHVSWTRLVTNVFLMFSSFSKSLNIKDWFFGWHISTQFSNCALWFPSSQCCCMSAIVISLFSCVVCQLAWSGTFAGYVLHLASSFGVFFLSSTLGLVITLSGSSRCFWALICSASK